MIYRVDINCDLGESFGRYKLGQDDKILKLITSANIACGFHAGDPRVMYQTVKMAYEQGVAIGAHPGYPDLNGFGRREMKLSADEIYQLMVYQIGALQGFARLFGVKVEHVKPHGALYNQAAKDRVLAEAVAKAVADLDQELILFGLAGSELVRAGEKAGLRVAQEVFADRTYQADGTLTPRSRPDALIHDSDLAVKRVVRMIKEGKVETVDGAEISIKADTICVHGDEETALEFVKKLRAGLEKEGIEISKVGDIR
ncbi:lactam utilization protein LamB [Anoxybacter fermentans]|uniref:5-oxoprolinase subunit A n=1 Tax=Anoxybacter fermentans TaxID=1323375 RepID=A0A3S9SUY3_9FIRM|nr:5-oxoprolinase subunit PxpA [Anoxybacter fermentans]AZR72088.1 lactam utilization protein LamB [Anoxybacter fermentans]